MHHAGKSVNRRTSKRRSCLHLAIMAATASAALPAFVSGQAISYNITYQQNANGQLAYYDTADNPHYYPNNDYWNQAVVVSNPGQFGVQGNPYIQIQPSNWSTPYYPGQTTPAYSYTIGSGTNQITVNGPVDPAPTTDNVLIPASLTVNDNVNATVANLDVAAGSELDVRAKLTVTGTMENDGLTSVGTNSAANEELIFGGGTLQGSGTVQLTGNNYLSGTLTLSAGETINGTGIVQAAVTNDSVIVANTPGGTLQLEPASQITGYVMTNDPSGIWEASNGGNLSLNGQNAGSFTNNGTIEALEGSTVTLNSNGGRVYLSGGTLTTVGSGTIHNAGFSNLTSVTNNGTFIADDGSYTYLKTGLTNNSANFTINAQSDLTAIILSSPVTIDGTGTITMSSTGHAYIYAANNTDRLTLGANQVLQGAGQVGDGGMSLTSNNIIDANVPTAGMTLYPNTGCDFTNNDVWEATNGATLSLNGASSGTFNNNGTIEALDGSTVTLNSNGGGVYLNGGILTTAGSGTIHNTGFTYLTSVTNNGTFIADDGANTFLTTQLTNNGNFTINAVARNSYLRLTSPVTINGTGTITLSSTPGQGGVYVYANNNTGRLTLGPNQVIQGSGQLGDDGMTLTNNGTIDANVSTAGLTLYPNGDFTNATTGTWEATNGAAMTLTGGKFINSGTVEALDGSTVTFVSGSANLTNNSGGTLTGGTYEALSISSPATINLSGGNVATNAATVILSGAQSSIPQINSMTSNSGEFEILGGRSFTTASALANSGALVMDNVSSLKVNGTYSQTAAGTLDVDLGGATPTLYSQLAVTGSASLNGTLNVALNVGFTPTYLETFDILTTTGFVTGTFSGPAPAGFTVQYNSNSVILTAVPEPACTSLIMAVGAGLMARRRRN